MPGVPALVTSALVVDTATVGFLQATGTGGERVREWYRTLRVGAYAMDVLSLIIGAYIAMRLAPDSLWKQLLLVVAVQMTHDILFGLFVRSRMAKGPLMSLFRRYADEMGASILVADALMMIFTVLLAHHLASLSSRDLAFAGAVAAYVGLLAVHSF